MAIPSLPDDFKELLKSLDSNGVDYLLVGGYAVNIQSYVRTTNDLDIVSDNLRFRHSILLQICS